MEQQVRAVLRQAVDDVNSAPHLMPGIRLDVDLEFIPAHDSFAASRAGTLLALPALGLCGAGSTKRYNAHPSVCPICPLRQRAAGLMLWARRVGAIDRLLHGRRRSSAGPQLGTQ